MHASIAFTTAACLATLLQYGLFVEGHNNLFFILAHAVTVLVLEQLTGFSQTIATAKVIV